MVKNKPLQIRLSEKELEEAKEVAKIDHEGNVSQLIRKLLRDYIKEVKGNEI